MEWLKRLGAAIDYIEENLDREISYDEVARIACCSTYYFQRIFSYVSGVSLSEYIRRRKMTQAAFELQRTDNKVIDVAHKYGYSSPTCTPILKKVRAAEAFVNGSIVCTVNSFTSNEMKPYDDANGNDYDSHKRYRTVIDSFSSERIKDEYIETTQHLLKGDYGFMCQYDNEPDFETVWSSIFDLDSLVIYRAEGDPRKNKFVTDSRLYNLIRRG